MNEQKFQVGDRCELFGVRCKVDEIGDEKHTNFPVKVAFTEEVDTEYGNEAWLTLDGKECQWHKTPSLILIERPKKMKKVKRLVEAWVNVYTNGNQYTYGSEECADACSDLHGVERISKAVYLCKEIEYEVENDY